MATEDNSVGAIVKARITLQQYQGMVKDFLEWSAPPNQCITKRKLPETSEAQTAKKKKSAKNSTVKAGRKTRRETTRR